MNNLLFEPFTFSNGLTLRNRVIMAPMTTWSGNDDGTVSDEEISYYRRRAQGVGLVLTGCTHVSANGIGFTGEFASYDDKFTPSLSRLANAAKSGGAPAVLQIFHAGNKAEASVVAAEDIVSASSVPVAAGPFNAAGTVPRPLRQEEILDVISAFGAATRRAIEAGFDGIELHGAHGFLLQNFFSPAYNQRDDQWGGSRENRMRFPIAVVNEVKRVIAEFADRPFLVGYRISPEEPDEGGLRIDDAYGLIDRLVDAGVDYIHASLSNILEAKPIDSGDDHTIAELIAKFVAGRVPVIAAGQIRTPDQARRALDLGLSLVAVGQGLVINPNWVELSENGDEKHIEIEVRMSRVPEIEIPGKLWGVIQAAKGWFKVIDDRTEEPRKATA
ncbi:NADH-dependent flavin oxidoreductase [Agrobacterium tumefaciens]|uniref:NADH-dependent flavin oxidoreductase n=1 Tax=Agrobacterium tumefaciens TaxID=358 RepID=UPI00129A5512|nr:NADH-dependent flavin oxidoreductase [Agrobacterium tumefaciens]MRH98223.1 NADH:flavin oxidoreductase [Agrobacterium tumefaciens]